MVLRQVGIFEANEMKFGVANRGELLVIVRRFKSSALREGGDCEE
jgi:hypothetical protein